MKQKLLFIFLLLLPFSVVAESNSDQAPQKIGVILPLSGGLAYIGQDLQRAMQMADEKYDPQFKFDLLFEDNVFNPRNTVSAAQKLINNDHVSGLIVFGSSTAFAAAPIAETHRLPMIGCGVLEKISAGRKYVVRNGSGSTAQHQAIINELKHHDYKTLAIVSTIQDGMLLLRDMMVEDRGKDVVYNQEFLPDAMEFGGALARVKGLNPDAVYLLLLPPQASTFAKQLRALGYKGDFFGGPQVGNMGEIEAAQGAFENIWFENTGDQNAGEYFAEFEKRFGRRPIFESMMLYDSTKMMIEALKTEQPAEYLRSVKNFQGIIGTYSATGKNDFDIPVEIYRVKDGRIVK